MDAPDPQIERDPSPSPVGKALRELLLLIGGGSVLAIVIYLGVVSLSDRPSTPRREAVTRPSRADFIGSWFCSDCHPGETAAHARSGHSKTLRPIARTPLPERLDGVTVADPERPDASWSYLLREGKFTTERREADAVERFVIDYAFGSGHHATTLVTLTDRNPGRPTMLEHRLTVFAHKPLPDVTPGQSLTIDSEGNGPGGRRYAAENTLKCFECHTTFMSDEGPKKLDEVAMIPNVDCERCHGPGRSHVEAAKRGAEGIALRMPFGAGRSSNAEQMKMCGSCHRLPEMGDPSQIRTDNPVLARFQPVGLMQSACYRKSAGELSCTTCHNPHARTSTDRVMYEKACLSCHQGPSHTPCKLNPVTGCVDCHMPRRDVSRGMMLTDHWIRSPDRPNPGSANAPATQPE